MTHHRTTALLAAGSLAAALAAAVAPTAAAADPVSTTYTCSAFGSSIDLPVSVTPPPIPSGLVTGFAVPAGLVSSTAQVTVPPAGAALLNTLGVDGGSSPDFAYPVTGPRGTTEVGVDDMAVTSIVTHEDDSMTLSATGRNAGFTTPPAGTYAITMPAAFSLVATRRGTTVATLNCLAEDPSAIGTVTFAKRSSSLSPRSVTGRKGHPVTVPVKVITPSGIATGTVRAALDGKRTLPAKKLVRGKATLALGKLAKGRHKLLVRYLGDADTAASRATITVTVK